MLVTQIIAWTVFIISVAFTITCCIFGILKNVGSEEFGLSMVFFALLLVFPLGMVHVFLFQIPEAWGASYIFIFVNILISLAPYCLLQSSLIFTKNHIYRLNYFLIPKRYSYKDVVRYRMQYDSTIHHSRFGPHKIISYEVEIWFSDNKYSSFSTKNQDRRKVRYIKNLLTENHCKQNGKIKTDNYNLNHKKRKK